MRHRTADQSLNVRRALMLVWFILPLAGCSPQNDRSSDPTEEELHASDFGTHVTEPSHAFLCQDGTRLLLIYKNDGLGIELRRQNDPQPIALTAAKQGAAFKGSGLTAVMIQRKLILNEPGRAPLSCTRQTIG